MSLLCCYLSAALSSLPSDFIVPCSSQHNHTVILLHRGAVGILSSFITLVQKQSGGRDAELIPVEPGQVRFKRQR